MRKFLLLFAISFSLLSYAKTYVSDGQKFQVENLFKGSEVIWGFDFLPNDQIIFTERSGKIKIFDLKTKATTEVKGGPEVWTRGQGGLLDVRVHPKKPDHIYLTYSEPFDKKSATAFGVGILENQQLKNFKKLFGAAEPTDETIHFGSRIEFDGQGFIFITIGERNDRDKSQHLGFHNGKIIRLKEDGSVPSDNPFVNQARAKPEIWSYGHRNPQGLVRDPVSGVLWSSEMGPRGGDELNIIKPGLNYGWPEATYGREYWGPKIGEKTKVGTEQPVVHWTPSISPSGITIYNGTTFPKWKGNIFLGNLSSTHLRRVVVDGVKVKSQEELLKDLGERIRNVRTGPDGFLYISTDSGRISRLITAK